MDYNASLNSSGNQDVSGSNGVSVVQAQPVTNSVQSAPPLTATGVPHFTLPSAETHSVIPEGFLQFYETADRSSMEHLQHLRGIPVPIHYFARDPMAQTMQAIPYPNQFAPNMLLQKQNPYVMSHVPYPIGLYPPMPNYPMPTHTASVIPLPPQNATATAHLLSNTNPKTPQVIYRNLFHTMHCKFQQDTGEWEGCRIYINDGVGYSGNAKRFKRKPDKGEKALVLDSNVYTSNDQPAQQCLSCRDYFETQKYYKANPDCIGRIVLVKNNAPIRVENGQFKILIKMMCCCVHHTVDYFTFQLNMLDGDVDQKTPRVVFSAKVPLSVKQWRKSNQKKEECVMILEPKS